MINKRRKKIAIFTIKSKNYGNRLQNYALQTTLNKKGFIVSTLQDRSTEKKIDDVLYNHSNLENFRGIIGLYVNHKLFIKRLLGKENHFDLFNMEYMNDSKDCISKEFISSNIKDKYDAFIVGSDQVWNTTFDFVSVNSFLPFPHPNKIAFSASFGVDSIPYDQKIVDCIKDFKALSVREEAGAKIIKELTGIDATVLVDPTMLLTVDEWRKVEKKPRGIKESKKTEKPKDGYILTYFLSPKCDEAKKQLEEVKGDREVYELLNPEDMVAGTAGPSEFLWLFDHADIILTDSFHACVFSFLFNKPFIVYDRQYEGESMNSRLETLLSKFHLERKYASSGLENDIWEHDYEEGYKQLELEREKAMIFLKEALGEIK